MIGRYLAFDIGCIECGEPSAVIGTFDTADVATAAALEAQANQEADWHGQHYFQVYDLETHSEVEMVSSPVTLKELARRLSGSGE